MDEVVTYCGEKKEIRRRDGTIAKYAIGTTIWTFTFFNGSKILGLYAIAKDGIQSRSQFEEILRILPQIDYVYSDAAVWYRNAEQYMMEMYQKDGLSYREALEKIPVWIAQKGPKTNIIEGMNNALRNGVSSIKRRCSGPSKTVEFLQYRLNLVCNRMNAKFAIP